MNLNLEISILSIVILVSSCTSKPKEDNVVETDGLVKRFSNYRWRLNHSICFEKIMGWRLQLQTMGVELYQ